MARFWTASAVKLEDVDAYLVSCGDKLKVEVTCREFVRLVSSVLLYPLPDNMTGSAVILMKTEEKKVTSSIALLVIPSNSKSIIPYMHCSHPFFKIFILPH